MPFTLRVLMKIDFVITEVQPLFEPLSDDVDNLQLFNVRRIGIET